MTDITFEDVKYIVETLKNVNIPCECCCIRCKLDALIKSYKQSVIKIHLARSVIDRSFDICYKFFRECDDADHSFEFIYFGETVDDNIFIHDFTYEEALQFVKQCIAQHMTNVSSDDLEEWEKKHKIMIYNDIPFPLTFYKIHHPFNHAFRYYINQHRVRQYNFEKYTWFYYESQNGKYHYYSRTPDFKNSFQLTEPATFVYGYIVSYNHDDDKTLIVCGNLDSPIRWIDGEVVCKGNFCYYQDKNDKKFYIAHGYKMEFGLCINRKTNEAITNISKTKYFESLGYDCCSIFDGNQWYVITGSNKPGDLIPTTVEPTSVDILG